MCIWIDCLAHLVPPASDAFNRKLRCIVVNADIYPPGVGCQVIDPIGCHLAQLRIDEVIDPHLFGLANGLILPGGIPKVTNQFLLLGIDRDDRVFGSLVLHNYPGDVCELGITVLMDSPFSGLLASIAD